MGDPVYFSKYPTQPRAMSLTLLLPKYYIMCYNMLYCSWMGVIYAYRVIPEKLIKFQKSGNANESNLELVVS